MLKDADNLKIYELLSLVSSGQNIGNYIKLQAVSQLGRSSAKISRFNVGVLADLESNGIAYVVRDSVR